MSISRNVEITIKGSQGYSSDDMKSFELFVMGTLKKVKDRWVLSYENENSGLTKIILWSRKTVIVKSDGDINYCLRLSENKTTKAIFKSYGLFSRMSTYTSKIDIDMAKEKKNIELCYDLDIDCESVVKNNLSIFIGLLND